MKKYIVLTVLAMAVSMPAKADSVKDTHIKRTLTAVEKAAVEQGFSKRAAGYQALNPVTAPAMSASPLLEDAAPMKRNDIPVMTGNHSVMMMAPKPLPVEASKTVPATSGARPSLVLQNLPHDLVMDGPGTKAYKKKKRNRKAVVKQEAHAPAEEHVMMREDPSVMPDHNSLPPQDELKPDMGRPADEGMMPPEDPFGDFGQ